MRLAGALVGLSLLLAACGGRSLKAAGTEGGPCYGNGTCNAGLTCNTSNVCEATAQDPCEGIACSGHGTCAVAAGSPLCACDNGYHADGLACVPDHADGGSVDAAPTDGMAVDAVGTDGGVLDAAADGKPKDAGQTDGPRVDAAPDAAPCTFDDNLPCELELQACTTVGTATAECGGLDCVDNTIFGKMCLRPCTCTDACQRDLFCVPKGLVNFNDTRFASLGGHCFWSYCGNNPDYPFGNGDLLGACEVGGDEWIKAGRTQTKPGFCLAHDSRELIGECKESGDAARGGPCTFWTGASCKLREGWTGCAQDSVCLGRSGVATGTCAKLCDPSTAGFDPAVAGGDCAAGGAVDHDQYCQDSSTYGFYPDTGDLYVAYIGFCIDEHGCDALAATNRCVGTGKLCFPTSNVSGYGLCLAPDGTSRGTCETVWNLTDPTKNCAFGYLCLGSATIGECRAYCGRGTNDGVKPCAGADACVQVATSGSGDLSLNWGACQPGP